MGTVGVLLMVVGASVTAGLHWATPGENNIGGGLLQVLFTGMAILGLWLYVRSELRRRRQR